MKRYILYYQGSWINEFSAEDYDDAVDKVMQIMTLEEVEE